MVQMVSRALKPLGRPKQKRPTAKLQNTTIRDFGGGLNVVDSEQNLTSKFSPVFDNMVTYTDRRVGPRYGYEMWMKLKQGTTTSGTVNITITTSVTSVIDPYVVVVNWTAHPLTGSGNEHIAISGWDLTFNGIVPDMMNRTHSVRRVINANAFEIVMPNAATLAGTSPPDTINYTIDSYLLGGIPIEAKYFANYVIVWSSTGEIIRVDRNKNGGRIWSNSIAYNLSTAHPVGWTFTELIASDVFGKELICSNGHEKPLTIDFTRDDPTQYVKYLVDPGNSSSNVEVPAFDACKSAFRFFTVHDTDPAEFPEHVTEIRISAKDQAMVFSGAPAVPPAAGPGDSIDIDMSKVAASPEQTIRGFAIIKDTVLVIAPTFTTLMKYGAQSGTGTTIKHDPQPVDTLNGFGSNSPRSIVEIGSDVFMLDFNGVPSARLSTIGNAVLPARVSNYIETMMSSHIGRLLKETMRLKTFGFYDSKNKCVHYYLPKYDVSDARLLTTDPLFFDDDMAADETMKRTLIMRVDEHQFEQEDTLLISGATGFANIDPVNINGIRKIAGILNNNYILISIGVDLPRPAPATNSGGGGNNITIQPMNDGTVGYIYHYVPALKLQAWSRFKTKNNLKFTCGCGTIEGRSFLFTPDGYMMRYGSPDHQVFADWYGMYDFASWTSGQAYVIGNRIFDASDGLVYKCLQDITTIAADFKTARELAPDNWEEYKGEGIDFAWELPWSDFGTRQATKALRFMHLDANGTAQFTVNLFADNIYKNATNGQFTPARSLTYVPNEAGAYGIGYQVYGAGRRTREQKLWQVPIKCKLLKLRTQGSTTGPLSISAISLMYHRGSVVRG